MTQEMHAAQKNMYTFVYNAYTDNIVWVKVTTWKIIPL